VLGLWTFTAAIARLGPAGAAAFGAMVPVVTAVGAWAWLGERRAAGAAPRAHAKARVNARCHPKQMSSRAKRGISSLPMSGDSSRDALGMTDRGASA